MKSVEPLYRVKQAALEDRIKIKNFLHKAYRYRSHYKYPQRWHWEYVENPYWKEKLLPIWIAIDRNEEIIGQTCAMYVPLKIHDEEIYIAWSTDTIVLSEYRGKGVGGQLQKESSKKHRVFMSLSMSPINRKIKLGFGSKPIVDVETFIRWNKIDVESYNDAVAKRIDSVNFLRNIWIFQKKNFDVGHLAVIIINAIIRIINNTRGNKSFHQKKIKIIQIEKFGSSFHKFWDKIKKDYDVIVKRDAEYLNWRFYLQPHMDYEIYVAIDHNQICGYMVLRECRPPEPAVGIISELITSLNDQTTQNAFVEFAVKRFANSCEAIRCVASSIYLKKILKSHAFFVEQKDTLLAYSHENEIIRNLQLNTNSYFFSKADHDWDQSPLEGLKYKFWFFNLDQFPFLRKMIKQIAGNETMLPKLSVLSK